MHEYVTRVSAAARAAVSRKEWATVHACAREILQRDDRSAEGFFLSGLVMKAQNLADGIAIDPAQYLWSYRRFKSQPEGQPDFYA